MSAKQLQVFAFEVVVTGIFILCLTGCKGEQKYSYPIEKKISDNALVRLHEIKSFEDLNESSLMVEQWQTPTGFNSEFYHVVLRGIPPDHLIYIVRNDSVYLVKGLGTNLNEDMLSSSFDYELLKQKDSLSLMNVYLFIVKILDRSRSSLILLNSVEDIPEITEDEIRGVKTFSIIAPVIGYSANKSSMSGFVWNRYGGELGKLTMVLSKSGISVDYVFLSNHLGRWWDHL